MKIFTILILFFFAFSTQVQLKGQNIYRLKTDLKEVENAYDNLTKQYRNISDEELQVKQLAERLKKVDRNLYYFEEDLEELKSNFEDAIKDYEHRRVDEDNKANIEYCKHAIKICKTLLKNKEILSKLCKVSCRPFFRLKDFNRVLGQLKGNRTLLIDKDSLKFYQFEIGNFYFIYYYPIYNLRYKFSDIVKIYWETNKFENGWYSNGYNMNDGRINMLDFIEKEKKLIKIECIIESIEEPQNKYSVPWQFEPLYDEFPRN